MKRILTKENNIFRMKTVYEGSDLEDSSFLKKISSELIQSKEKLYNKRMERLKNLLPEEFSGQ